MGNTKNLSIERTPEEMQNSILETLEYLKERNEKHFENCKSEENKQFFHGQAVGLNTAIRQIKLYHPTNDGFIVEVEL